MNIQKQHRQPYSQMGGGSSWTPGIPTPGGSMDPNSPTYQGPTPGQQFAQQQGGMAGGQMGGRPQSPWGQQQMPFGGGFMSPFMQQRSPWGGMGGFSPYGGGFGGGFSPFGGGFGGFGGGMNRRFGGMMGGGMMGGGMSPYGGGFNPFSGFNFGRMY
jgi:hypothetical protein